MSDDENLRDSDIEILKEFYYATDGDNWDMTPSWIFTPDCRPCETFEGIYCESSNEGYMVLHSMILGHVGLHGTIPESIFELRNMSYFDLNSNHLYGTLSEKIGQFQSLFYLYLNDNFLSGSVPSELSTITYVYDLDLSSNYLSGELHKAFDPVNQVNLAFVSLDNNEFTGNIPSTLARLGNLNTVSIGFNCFDGSIPTDFCESTRIHMLDLSGANMGRACRTPFINFKGSESFLMTKQFDEELPRCLFEIPTIYMLYMDGMGLRATLPSDAQISINLMYLTMSNNNLYGEIPYNFQNNWFEKIDLSYNKLNGVLLKSFSQSPSVSLYYNRLSYILPASLYKDDKYTTIKILEGNSFDCNSDRSNLPHHDPYYPKYQSCGSDSFNITLYESAGTIVGAVLLLCLMVGLSKCWSPLRKWFQYFWQFRADYAEVMKDTSYYHWSGFVCSWVCMMTVVILAILAPMYIALSAYYATQTYKYAWVVSGVYLNGIVATVCMLLILFLLGGSVYWSMRRCGVSFAAQKGAYTMNECWSVTKIAWVFVVIIVVLVDIVAVIMVNTSYIAVSRLYSESTVQKVSIAMSVYKIVWNFLIIRNVLKVLTFKSPIRDFRIQQQWFTSLETALVLFNNIIAPYVATLIVSANCLQSTFVRNSDYAFIYSFQCSSTFITTYASVFLFMFALTAVGFPVVQGFLMWSHFVVYPRKEHGFLYFWTEKMFSIVQPKLLFPEIVVEDRLSSLLSETQEKAVEDEEQLLVASETEGISWRRVLSKRLFCADLMVVDMVSMFAIMLTFGAVVPAVAVLGCCAVLSQSVFNELMIGRGISKVKSMYGGAADAAEKISKFREELLLECRAFGDLFKLNIFICVPFVVVFYGLLVFDMLGDTEGSEKAIWAPVAVLCIVVGLTVSARYDRFTGCCVDGKRSSQKSFVPLVTDEVEAPGKDGQFRGCEMEKNSMS